MNHELTPREIEILAMVSQGLPWKQITDKCGIARGTMVNHIHSLRHKLGAFNTPHAVAIAKDKGII
jgi:DNA-binding CsgD family transcriptional regulator